MGVRFDFCPFFNPGETIAWTETASMMRRQTALAEEAGFTTVWLTEHHFAHNGYLNAPPNPILMSADLAARHSRIRVGQAPVVLPDWHPLRVAEDIALLDNLSDGRVDFGAARGTNERAGIQFNLDADKRDDKRSYALFRECLDIVTRAWTEDPFRHEGEFYRFPVPGWKETNRMFLPHDPRYHAPDGEYIGMYVHPRPVQRPHPPTWLMSNAPFTFEFAGRSGYGCIAMASPIGGIRACWQAYLEAAHAAGRTSLGLGENVGMCTAIYVADTMEEAARTIRPAINTYYELLSGVRPNGEWMKRAYLAPGEELTAADAEADWFDFLSARDVIWIGTADHVAEKLQRYVDEVSLSQVMLLQQFPGVRLEQILGSMERFAERVMPRFAPSPPTRPECEPVPC